MKNIIPAICTLIGGLLIIWGIAIFMFFDTNSQPAGVMILFGMVIVYMTIIFSDESFSRASYNGR